MIVSRTGNFNVMAKKIPEVFACLCGTWRWSWEPSASHPSLPLWPLPFLFNCDLIIYFNDKHSHASCIVKCEGHYAAFLQSALSVNHVPTLTGLPTASSPYTQEAEGGLVLVPREMLFQFTWCFFLPLQHGRTDSFWISPKFCASVLTHYLLVVTCSLNVVCVVLGSTAVFRSGGELTPYVRTTFIMFKDILTKECSREDHMLANWDLI